MDPERSAKFIVVEVLGVMGIIALFILLVTAPVESLLGESVYGIRSAFHGLFAGILMVTMTIGLYQAFRLWNGTQINAKELGLGSLINSIACYFTIVFGNWIYIPYRAKEGPRSHFLEVAPEIHKIFFEFKEFVALFTLPLVVAATYIIFKYADRLNQHKQVRVMVALLLVLAFFYFVIAFGLGAAITKLKSV